MAMAARSGRMQRSWRDAVAASTPGFGYTARGRADTARTLCGGGAASAGLSSVAGRVSRLDARRAPCHGVVREASHRFADGSPRVRAPLPRCAEPAAARVGRTLSSWQRGKGDGRARARPEGEATGGRSPGAVREDGARSSPAPSPIEGEGEREEGGAIRAKAECLEPGGPAWARRSPGRHRRRPRPRQAAPRATRSA
jgi:hypothetical protein